MNVSWSAQHVAELLTALGECDDEPAALAVALRWATHAFPTPIAAWVPPEPEAITAAGFGDQPVPERSLRAVARGTQDNLDLPGAGPTPALVTEAGDGSLVLARPEAPFTDEDADLARGLAKVLTLHLRQLRLFEAERAARTELQDRQRLLERMYAIQQAIARRQPLERVLDAICEATAEIMPGAIVGIRLVDPENHDQAPLVAWVGMEGEVPADVRNRPTRSGLSGKAMDERRLVVATDYRAALGHDHWYAAKGVCSSMAAPVTQDNEVVGGMIVSFTRPHEFTPLEQETLLTFAEHVSLALNDASALTAMSDALDDALHQATHDPLTSLPNRALVLDRLSLAIGRAGRTGDPVTLLFVDLDRFKRVNDYLGHRHGDAVLVAVAGRLTATLRPGDTVGRLAGDEFVVIAEDLDDHDADLLAGRLAEAIAEPLSLEGRDMVVTASIGIARAAPGVRAEDVLGDADTALYRAKAQGRSRIERFDQALRTRMATRSETEQALHRALRNQELRVWYQPTIWTPGLEPLAVEALVRWERPGHGLVSPADFVPLAEETGQIVALGAWVLEQACAQVARWRAEEHRLRHLLVAVNVSPRQLTDPGMAGLVDRVLRENGLPAESLWLEVTEHVFLEEDDATLSNMEALHRAGVRFVIDDFGTGYSSLTYLKRFPVTAIKIDHSFVAGLGKDHGDEAIVNAIIRLGEAMGLGVVAEGVERTEQVAHLHQLGCDMVQGYLFGRPAPAEAVRDAMVQLGLPGWEPQEEPAEAVPTPPAR